MAATLFANHQDSLVVIVLVQFDDFDDFEAAGELVGGWRVQTVSNKTSTAQALTMNESQK